MRTSTRTLVVLSGLAAVGTLSTTIILPSFPAMAASLNAAPADMALTLSSFFLVFAVGQLLVGPLSDRYGRRPLILGGLTLFVLGSLLGAGATDLSTMVAARVIQAAGVCAASVLRERWHATCMTARCWQRPWLSLWLPWPPHRASRP